MAGNESEPCLIGIDCGTQSIRAIAFDATGRKLAGASRSTPLQPSETGGEYDPDAIFAAALAALKEVAGALAGRPVAAIGVASFGESCVVTDKSGKALGPSIAWFDQRTEPQARAIRETADPARVFAITGHTVDRILTLCKLAWMRDNRPAVLAVADRVLMMADWIAYRLCGEAATDPSLASRTLYFDTRGRRWSEELLALAGLEPSILPSIASAGTRLAPVRADVLAETGLAGRPEVGVGGHDQIVGSFAAGLIAPGMVLDSVGTAEALSLITTAPLADADLLRHGYFQTAVGTNRRLIYVGGGLDSSGGAIEWLRALVGSPPQATLIAEAEAIPAGSGGVVFLPHLANGPPPEPDPDARGAFVGLSVGTTRGALYRAVLEGLAFQARMMFDGLVGLPGVTPPSEIRVIGGSSRNPLFLAIKANVYGRPLVVIDEPEATALGAALLGGIAAGVYRDLDEALAGLDRREHVIEPDGDASVYLELRRRVFERLHPALRGVNHALALIGARSPA